MVRKRVRYGLFAVFVMALGATALASDSGFTANVGLEISYIPVPPASYNIGSDLSLGFDISGFSLSSVTGFDLGGFVSEGMSIGVDLGAVQISEEIRFEPIFEWNDLSLDLAIVGVEIGMDWILANIGSVQTPQYTMAGVFEVSSGIVCGFSITSITGFGAIDLVNLLGGSEAPFSDQLLDLFNHVASLCAPAPDLDVTVVSDFYFEEELVRLVVDYQGLIASNTTWFDSAGLAKMLFELGYRFGEPELSFLTTMTLDGSFAITGLDFILDLQIDAVRFTSQTSFAEPAIPTLIPIVFSGQRFAVSFELCGVTITSITAFDDSFLFNLEEIAIEADIDPVHFVSLTAFDALGFDSQCVYAEVTFCGVRLYTQAEFDFGGVESVTFGFELSI